MTTKPEIGDIIKIVFAGSSGENEEIIGRLEGYQHDKMAGVYVKLKGEKYPIYSESIINWEIILKKPQNKFLKILKKIYLLTNIITNIIINKITNI
jgi:hypothetical protein